ncbi:MAG: type I methionyl aminopeptidase [Synergistetes bacterium]|nr:type I methionyl aminopeptidase [Synergistota bacterium]MCX8128092.1 type I methionyl aminopeptidase [Synergistota bacterium]MDW8192468.1 type I methionyl aminopeptidase [Synergistota bacterium]
MVISSNKELNLISVACRIVAETLIRLSEYIKPGVSTLYLDRVAERYILSRGGFPAFKGYKGYPATLCISINKEVVHGIPSHSKILKEGDIVSIDVGVKYKGYYGDGAWTFPVGEINDEARKLIEVTKSSLDLAISIAKAGVTTGDIGNAIQSYVESHGFSVVRDYAGHGIGKELHEFPQLPNFGKPGTGPRLEEGMVLAIEPMVNSGSYEVEVLPDGWTVVTKDGSLSAHFEHTILVRKEDSLILTKI